EAVEAAVPPEAHEPALGRVGVHIFKVLEVRRIFRLAHQRQAVLPFRLGGGDGRGEKDGGGQRECAGAGGRKVLAAQERLRCSIAPWREIQRQVWRISPVLPAPRGAFSGEVGTGSPRKM